MAGKTSGAAAKGQRVGYVRVSSAGQNTARQLSGVELDRVFEDHASGKGAARPALNELRRYVREGDVVIVHSMDRLARDLDDLRALVDEFTGRGVQVEFVKEGLGFSGDTPMSRLLLSVMGAVAEFERALIRERQREGIEVARVKGAYRGCRRALSQAQVEQVRARVAAGESKAALARELGIARETLYQALRG